MNLRFPSPIVTLIGLTFLFPLMLSAQYVSSTAWLKISDDAGGHDSLVFGNNWIATYCLDTALGENASPPRPPSGFWAVFMSIPGRANCFTTLGIIRNDLRPFKFTYPADPDTFDIDFGNLDSAAHLPGVTVRLQWKPIENSSSARSDSMFMEDRVDGALFTGRIDMLAQDTLEILKPYDSLSTNPTAPIVKLRVLKYTTYFADGVQSQDYPLPDSFAMQQNYPNPFNPSTLISYTTPKHAYVRLQVFNPLGQLVRFLVNEDKVPGNYSVGWNANGVASGLYFYRIQAGEFIQTKKAILIR